MKTLLKTTLFSAILLFAVADLTFGQSNNTSKPKVADNAESIVIRFPFDKSEIDPDFIDNTQNLSVLYGIMSKRTLSELDSIIITGSFSPEGNPRHNRILAQRRANSVMKFILENYPDVKPSICRIHIDEGYWDGLIRLVEQDPNVPARDEFLEMLKDPRLSDNVKTRKMETMRTGKVYAYLNNNLVLRQLRQSTVLVTFRTPVQISQPESKQEPEYKPQLQPQPQPQPFETMPEVVPMSSAAVPRYNTSLALRTNLLLDVLGGFNVGVEVPFGKNFSAAADFVHAYMRINNRFALQTIQASAEARYWFKQGSNALTGWNLGIYGTYCSRFDVQFGRGFQGDGYWSCGLSGGYAIPLSKRLNLDFSAAGGFFHSPEIREYSKPQNGHLIWEKTRYNVNRIALTQVRVNLVWLINRK